jgi:hypothetical protein
MTSITLTTVADTLVAALRTALPDIPTIEVDPPPREQRSLTLPAIYIEIIDIEPLLEAGDSRLLADLRWEAHCLVDPIADRASLILRSMAARVAVALHEIRRPVPGHGHIRLVRAGESAFRPELEAYLSWSVEFSIEIALGDLAPETIIPSTVYLNEAPLV